MTRHLTIAALVALAAGAAQAGAPALTEGHLQVFDLDADGAVSKAEYRVTTSNVFIMMDADHDNALVPAEAEGIPEELFKAMDTDGDGMASRAEYDTQILIDFDSADLDQDGLLN